MRIGIDASRAARAIKTGVEWYSYHLIKQFSHIDHTNEFLLYTDRSFTDSVLSSLPSNFIEKKLSWPLPKFWTQGRLSLEMITEKPDILFVPSHALPIACPRKTVTTIHDVGFRVFGGEYDSFQRRYLNWAAKQAAKHASAIICVSEFTKQEFIHYYGADEKKVHVTHLGYDEERYMPNHTANGSALLASRGIKRPYILSISHLEKKKNVGTLLKAFDELKRQGSDLSLVIVGAKKFGAEELLLAMKKSYFYQDIHYLGWVEEEKKIALLQQATCMVFPGMYEGFGLPVIEAQACGVPVVCSNVGALPEITGNSALAASPDDYIAFANHIATLQSDKNLRDGLIKAGFINAARFGWRQCAEKTLKILTEV